MKNFKKARVIVVGAVTYFVLFYVGFSFLAPNNSADTLEQDKSAYSPSKTVPSPELVQEETHSEPKNLGRI